MVSWSECVWTWIWCGNSRVAILCARLTWLCVRQALYNKDDFFDSLSCETLDREGGRGERTKFSEQRKIDTEVWWWWLRGCLNGRVEFL